MTTKYIIISIQKDIKKKCLITEADKPNTSDRYTDTPTNWILKFVERKIVFEFEIRLLLVSKCWFLSLVFIYKHDSNNDDS